MDNRKIARNYYLATAFYWIIIAASLGYGAVYLTSKNFSYTQVGIYIASANILASIIQPLVASYADKPDSINIKNIILLFSISPLILLNISLIDSVSNSFIALAYIITLTFSMAIQPLLTAITIHLNNAGNSSVEFGVSRGIGSLTYAIISLLLGFLIRGFSSDIIVYTSIIAYVVFLIFLFLTPLKKERNIHVEEVINDDFTRQSMGKFIVKYKYFFLSMLATLLIFTQYNIQNNYWVKTVESIGGNENNLGTVIAIGAFAEIPILVNYTKIKNKFKLKDLILFSALMFIIKALSLYLIQNIYLIYLSQLMQALSFAIFFPSIVYYTSSVIEEKDMVKGQAFLASSVTLATVLGSLVGGILIDQIGINRTLFLSSFLPMLGLLILIYTMRRTDF